MGSVGFQWVRGLGISGLLRDERGTQMSIVPDVPLLNYSGICLDANDSMCYS